MKSSVTNKTGIRKNLRSTALVRSSRNLALTRIVMETLEDRRLMSVALWTGYSGDSQWNTAVNWQSDVVPVAGQSVEFPVTGTNTSINLGSNVTVGDITFDGSHYTLNNQSITVNGQINAPQGSDVIDTNLVLNHNTPITVGTSGTLSISSLTNGAVNDGLIKQGNGKLRIFGSSTFTGSTVVAAGDLQVDSSVPAAITVDSGASLDGNAGTVSGITGSGGSVDLSYYSPGNAATVPSNLYSSGNVSLGSGSTLQAAYDGIDPSELVVSGASSTINLTGANLSVALLAGQVPTVGTVLTVISNQTSNAVTGTFNGLAQGGSATFEGVTYQINYAGGSSGKDVTLTATSIPAVWTGGAHDGEWNTAGNWQAGTVPAAGASVEFPDQAAIGRTVDLQSPVSVGDIDFGGASFALVGSSITVNGAISSNNVGNSISNPIYLAHNTVVTVGDSDLLSVGQIFDGSNNYTITKNGAGTLEFTNVTSYGGQTEVAGGTVDIEASAQSNFVVDAGATLEGDVVGSIGSLTVNGGTVIPSAQGLSPDLINPISIAFNSGSSLVEQIALNGNSEVDSQLSAIGGTVQLTGTTLEVQPLNGYVPSVGDVITVISNQTGNAVSGTFSGLAQGASTVVGGVTYQISYTGGSSGQDVTLTVTNAPAVWTGAGGTGNSDWSAGINWQSGVAPTTGQSVLFNGAALNNDVTVDSAVTVGDIIFTGVNYDLSGSPITMDGNLTDTGNGAQLSSQLVLGHNSTITVDTTISLTLEAVSDGGNGYGITKEGEGDLVLQGADTFTGSTVIDQGRAEFAAQSDSSAVVVNDGATAAGALGYADGFTVNAGGTLAAGLDGNTDYVRSTGNVALSSGSNFAWPYVGTTGAEVIASGSSVNLGGSTLCISTTSNSVPAVNTVFTLISNQTGNAVTGTFAGLAQGAVVDVSGVNFQINYAGGSSGHDVTLTVVPHVASKLVFSQEPSSSAVAGQSLGTVAVQVTDAYGYLMTGNTSTVTLAGTSLTGTASVAAVGGVATFTGLAMTQTGTRTLTATDGSFTSATSSSVTITAAAGTHLSFTQQPQSAAGAGQSIGTVVVHVLDAYGNLATGDTSTVTLTATSLTGTTSVAAVGGVATFTGLTMTQTGTRTLTASDGSLTTATSSSITISATATQLTFSQQPSSTAVAGQSIGTVIVHVLDGNGNLMTGDTSSVTLAGTSLNGTATVNAVGGVATFTGLSMTLAGTRTLTATDASLTSATSSSITITAAAANHLSITQQPSGSATAGQSIGTVIVQVLDTYGNLVTGDTSSLTLAGTSLTGTTSVSAVGGIATFTGLSMTQAGTRTLTATDSSLTSATTSSVTITAAAANHLAFTQQPSASATVGQSIGTIIVQVLDIYGNLVTGDTSSVTLAGTSLTGTTTVAAVGGVATFTGLSMTQSGSRTLTATDGSLTLATSSAITLSAASATRLGFSQQPLTTANAGASIGTIIVDVLDTYGNIVTGNTSTVSLTGTSLTGTTSVAAVGGVATFTGLSMTQAGTRTLTAGDGGLTSATSNSITISAAAATHLSIAQQPLSSAVAGQSIGTILVQVLDAYGNIATGNTSTVTLAGTSLTGTASVAAVGGVATFSGLSMTQTGTRTITATDSSLTSATSSAITITAGTANHLQIAQQPSGTAGAGQPIGTVIVDVVDAYGNLVTSDNSSVTITGSPSPSGTTNVQVVNGVATLSNVEVDQSGSVTLSLHDGSLTPVTANPINITPGEATHLAIVQQPTGAAAGQAIGTVIAQVEDAYGNLVTNDNSFMTITGSPSLTGTTNVQVVNGLATFSNVSVDQAGTETLTVNDASLAPATANPINITPGAAIHLVIVQQPTGAAAGQPIGTVIAQVEDAYGNIVTTDNSSVTISGSPSPTGTTTVQVVNGVATLNNVAVDQAGTAALSLHDGGLAPATVDPINITPGAATHLTIIQQPTGASAGQPIGTVIAQVEDAYGNVVTTDNSSVAITGSPGPTGTTTVQVVNGVATLSNVEVDQAGNVTLSLHDGSLAPANASPINITPGAATHLVVVQQPTGAVAGQPVGTVVVDVEDAYGNLVTDDNSSVSLSSVGGVSGTGTVQAVHGVATFSNVSLTQAGNFALFATDGSLAGASTNSITVTPASNPTPPVITVSAYAKLVSQTSDTGTLHVQGEQDGIDANLTYTWSIINQPSVSSSPHSVGSGLNSAAPLAIFAINGTNSAKNTPVTFMASGEYTLQVVASNGTQSATSLVQVTTKVPPTAVRTGTTQVSGVQTIGNAQSITGFAITFNGLLDPTTAQNVLGYRILEQHSDGKKLHFAQWLFGINPGSQTETSAYKIASAVYDPQTFSVTLTLASPILVENGVRLVQVIGVGSHAVLGENGKAIDGDSNGSPGGNFTYRFTMSVARSVSYRTASGDRVKLSLAGPGKIVTFMPWGMATPTVNLIGTNSTQSILTGKIHKGRKSLGYAVLDQLNDPDGANLELGDQFHVNLYNGGQPL